MNVRNGSDNAPAVFAARNMLTEDMPRGSENPTHKVGDAYGMKMKFHIVVNNAPACNGNGRSHETHVNARFVAPRQRCRRQGCREKW